MVIGSFPFDRLGLQVVGLGCRDLGLQPGSPNFPDPKHQVYIRFELPGEQITYTKDGAEIKGPMSIGRSFTASMNQKANLRKFVESWFGKPFADDDVAADFDFKLLLGRRCLLNVVHNLKGERTYANIQTATPLPKGMVSEEKQHNPSLFYSLDEPDGKTFAALPEWLQKRINGRIEYTEALPPPVPANPNHGLDPDDDIPF
jgi:hypothetical protein